MTVLDWFVTLALALASGYSLVSYLTAHALRMSTHLIVTCLALFSLVVLLATSFSGVGLLLAGLLALAGFTAGYTLNTRRVLGRQDGRHVPELTRQPSDPGLGHTAVVYFTHGEPETYNPIGWLNQFREFDEQGIPFVPLMARPFFIYMLRRAYLRVGTSHHRRIHQAMARRLDEALHQSGYRAVKVYLSFLDDEPRPDAALIQALNEGASQVVVAEVFVSISNHTEEGENKIKAVQAEKLGVPLAYTGPLWDSPSMHQMFLEKANAAIGDTPPSRVGVLLVGHGQPDEWDREFPTETEQEIEFRVQVLKLLAANGYLPENMGLAWMEFKQPKPAELVHELLSKGVEKIIYFSAAISADSIHSQYDVPELVHKARTPAGFPLINMGAWNDHPLAIQAILERVVERIEALNAVPSIASTQIQWGATETPAD